jgi:hypothetical protein
MWTAKNRGRYDRGKLRYPSDLTDSEWELVEPLIPPGKRGGGKRTVVMREVVNGLIVHSVDRLSVAGDPEGPAAEEHALRLFRPVDLRRHIGGYSPRPLFEVSRTGPKGGQPHRRHHR